MIQRNDILSIPFLKKSAFTGSFQGMRYRMEKVSTEETDCLQVSIWEGPYSYEIAGEKQMEKEIFPFSEEGICQAVEWMNGRWKEQPERWKKAMADW